MNKYISCLGLLLTLSVGTPLLAQASKATPKQQTATNPSHTALVKKYQDWLSKEGYRPVKHEGDEWTWLEFKSEGNLYALNVEKKTNWLCLNIRVPFQDDDNSSWLARVYAVNKTNLYYRAVQVKLSEDGAYADLNIWAIDPKPEHIGAYLEIINAANRFYRDSYYDAVKIEQEEAKKQSETKKK